MIKGEPYGYEADIWAFGIFVFEMLMGMMSANGKRELETLAIKKAVPPK
jgi:serine/threonine protein kinase